MSRVNLQNLGYLADRRRRHLAAAEADLDAILDAIEAAGDDVNIKAVSVAAQIPRSLIYRRLAARAQA